LDNMRPDYPERDLVDVYRCDGCVSDAGSFLQRNLGVLSGQERAWLSRHEWRSPTKVLPGEITSNCLTINPDWTDEPTAVFKAQRSGDRSAYWGESSLKIKGCNPVLDGQRTFPFQVLSYTETAMHRKEIPYGVLSVEAAVREIFGSMFCRHHEVPVSTEPLLVYEYTKSGKHRGCGIVLATFGETRLESFLDDLPFSVHDVQRARESRVATVGGLALGSEQPLRGLNVWWWAEEKAKALIRLHWSGGFRGVLNSNPGNDVILQGPLGRSLLLCDFDSFEYHLPPRTSDAAALVPFLRKSFVEVLLGSLPIIDFVDACDAEDARSRIKEITIQSSSLWGVYWRQLQSMAEEHGITWSIAQQAAEQAWRADAIVEAASTRILGTHLLELSGRTIVPGKHYG
jgi:hypothetical protein